MNQDAKTKRIVVIGAGASGIGAARTLSAAGAEVIILEGRDRIGGRMRKHSLTKNLQKSSGLETGADHFVNIQLGANWIHGMDAATNPMFEVAQKLGLELHQTSSDDDPGDDVILFDSGDFKLASLLDSDDAAKVGFGRVSKEDYYESLSRYEWIKEYVDHIQFNYEKEDISLQAAFDLALLASESEIFGPCSAPQRRCLNWMYDRVSIDLGAHISQVSLNCYAEGVSDGQGGEALVKHIGYSGILDHLANEFPLDIRLNRQVASIAVLTTASSPEFGVSSIFESPSAEELEMISADLQRCALKDGRYVCVTCTDGETFVADACVVTVPVGALQAESIRFSPRPPSVITSVCASLKLGLMNLVWLWYPTAFWPEECNFLGVARDAGATGADAVEDNTIIKFSTFLVPPVFDNFGVRQPVLMCQIVGPYATTIESMSDQDIAAEATATLRAMFGAHHVPEAIGCAHSQWGSDPFSRGSWSYFPYRTSPAEEKEVEETALPVGLPLPLPLPLLAGGVLGGVGSNDQQVGQAGCGGQASEGVGVVCDGSSPGTTGGTSSVSSGSPTFTAVHNICAPLAEPSQSVTVRFAPNIGINQYDNDNYNQQPQQQLGVAGMLDAAATNTTALSTSTATAVALSSTRLRSVTISEAAASVLPAPPLHSLSLGSLALAAGHRARRYSSDFTGATSEDSDDSESTDSSDDDDDDEDSDGLPSDRLASFHASHGGGGLGGSGGGGRGAACASSSDEGALRHRSDDDILSAHLCYASEAMSVLNRGTVHGAYMSGIREATKILAYLDDKGR